jgi:hypothetical protein
VTNVRGTLLLVTLPRCYVSDFSQLRKSPMDEDENRQSDIARIARLKELAGAGMIDGQARYFSHLIDFYGDLGQPTTRRTFTDRERERVDLFLQSFAI